jgi:hypothetical protein
MPLGLWLDVKPSLLFAAMQRLSYFGVKFSSVFQLRKLFLGWLQSKLSTFAISVGGNILLFDVVFDIVICLNSGYVLVFILDVS